MPLPRHLSEREREAILRGKLAQYAYDEAQARKRKVAAARARAHAKKREAKDSGSTGVLGHPDL